MVEEGCVGMRGRKELDLRFEYSVESRERYSVDEYSVESSERVMGWREGEAPGPSRIG